MRSLISLSIKRPVLTSVIVIVFLLLGIKAFFDLPVQLLPKVDIPIVVVRTVYPGASPLEVERLITKPIEDALKRLENLSSMVSYSKEGISIVVLRFDYDVDITKATLDVSTILKQIAPLFPEDAKEPSVSKVDINASPFLVVGISGKNLAEIKRIVDNKIVPDLLRIEGLADINVYGPPDKEILIRLYPIVTSKYGISITKLFDVVKSAVGVRPAGEVSVGNKRESIKVKRELNSINDIKDIPVYENLSVKDVADVSFWASDSLRIARLNGKDIVVLEFIAKPNANVVTAAETVKNSYKALKRFLPADTKWEILYDSADFVKTAVRNVIRDMTIGVLLTALVLFLFLKSFGATLIVAISMPTSIIASFLPLALMGFSLNLMSTLGLAISTGVLVNNSILVLENIYRFRDSGYGQIESAIEGTNEIAVAVLSTTSTNLAVFLPIAFMGGIVGKFFNQFALTVVFSTLFSLWVAFTLTPMLASKMKRSTKKGFLKRLFTSWWDFIYDGFEQIHHFLVKFSVRFPKTTILLFLIIFVVVVLQAKYIGFRFLPQVDEGVVYIDVSFPPGISKKASLSVIEQIESYLSKDRYIKNIVISGIAGDRATVIAVLKDDKKRPSVFYFIGKWRKYFKQNIPGAEYSFSVSRRGGRGKTISVSVLGEDIDMLEKYSKKILSILRGIPNVYDIKRDWEMGKPEITIVPNFYKLNMYNIPLNYFFSEIRGYINGLTEEAVNIGAKQYDLRVKSAVSDDVFVSPLQFSLLPIAFGKNGFLFLGQLSDVIFKPGPTAINRVDGQRSITVSANVYGVAPSVVINKFFNELKKLNLPAGYTLKYGGEIERMQREMRYMVEALLLAIVLTFLFIAGLIESFLLATVIILSVPLSLIGIIPIFIATGTQVSIYAILGAIVLVGLVVNNAIVILDYAENKRKINKLSPKVAIAEACSVRLRPIVMADLTTLIAILPLALGLGVGGGYRAPMALVMAGGIVAGGIMSLFLIPAVYVLIRKDKK